MGTTGQQFGIHTVNTSARPSGSMSSADVGAHLTSKLQAAFQSPTGASFVDLGTAFCGVTSLDKYVSALQTDAVPHLFLSWQDETGQQCLSQPVQVALSSPLHS